jgi:hypothetical protein
VFLTDEYSRSRTEGVVYVHGSFLAAVGLAIVPGGLPQTQAHDDAGPRWLAESGKCTVEVGGYGVTKVEIRGDTANLREFGGAQPRRRRF